MLWHNMSITVTDAPGIQLQGPKDQYIMQKQHLDRYSAAQQRDLNLVRLYLQVHTLADMTDEQRNNTINLQYLDATRPTGFVSDNSWPRQSAPTKAQSRLWKRFIRSSYLRYVPHWIDAPKASRAAEPLRCSQKSKPNKDSLLEQIQSMPRAHIRLLDGFQQLATDQQVWKAFRSRRRIHVATDGGLHSQKGTHGWVISTGTKNLFQCAGPVDGPYDTSSSTRSELGGYASVLLFIRELSRFWGIRHRARLHWYCDSKAAISRVRRFASRTSFQNKMPEDADLISIIRSCQAELRTNIRIHWIKGHQDAEDQSRQLSLASRLNIKADALATMYRTSGRLKSSQSCCHEPEQRCSISIKNTRLTSQHDACIRFHINGYHLRNYVQEKQGWSNSTWDEVDFYIFGKHFRRLRPQQQATWMKVVHNQLPLGERRYTQSPAKEESLRKCPCCKITNENWLHFMKCQSNPAFLSSLKIMQDVMCTGDKHPVCHLIYSGLHHSLLQKEGKFQPKIDGYPHHLQQALSDALKSQDRIGWNQASKGYLSAQWREVASLVVVQPRRKGRNQR